MRFHPEWAGWYTSRMGGGLALVFALVGAPSGIGMAQTPAPAKAAAVDSATTITFADALRLALRQNTSVRQAENAAALSSATVQEQKLQFLPNLQLSTTGAQNVGRSFSESQGSIINQTTQSLTAGISSNVTLFNGLSNVASLRQANLASDASGRDLTRARQTAAFTVASNYLTLVTDQASSRCSRRTWPRRKRSRPRSRRWCRPARAPSRTSTSRRPW